MIYEFEPFTIFLLFGDLDPSNFWFSYVDLFFFHVFSSLLVVFLNPISQNPNCVFDLNDHQRFHFGILQQSI